MKRTILGLLLACGGAGYADENLKASAPIARSESSSNWQLVWSDEFDRDGLPDPSKWGCEEGFIRNKEPQYYTRRRLENARVKDGLLVIEGRKEKVRNAQYDPDSTDWQRSRECAEYTSGSLNTLNRAGWTYGRMEARAKVPAGSGVWPAFWMMGINRLPPLAEPEAGKVGWPFCGEIDIMEFIGKEPNTVHAAAHFPNPETGKHQAKGKPMKVGEPPSDDFHIYAVEWSPERIDYFYDDQCYHSVALDVAGEGADNPFRRPHYILLNLALGQWGGEIDESLLPQKFLVDYVRVYQAEPKPNPASSGIEESVAPETKQQSLDRLRQYYAKHAFRQFKLHSKKSLSECLDLLGDDGVFSDLRNEEEAIRSAQMDQSQYSAPQTQVSEMNSEASDRLWIISESFRKEPAATPERIAIREKVFKGFIHYASIEDGRANVSGGRFHPSCFAIPLANVNSYFCFFDEMQRVENGEETDPLFAQVNQSLKTMGMQSWTQPYRNDETDDNVISVERFQKHVWWVGGNALAYRPVLQVSFMMDSIPMVDVMVEVAKGAISPVSQTTYDDAFWTEGFTADGAGWGHGKQCLIWGYPVHGGKAAMGILKTLQGTPWAQQLERSNIDTLLNFIHGSAWYYQDGFIPPCLGRGNMVYDGFKAQEIPSSTLVESLLKDWGESLTSEELDELTQFAEEAGRNDIQMANQPEGLYTGSRYFYNNDDLIVKNDDFNFFINMASVRCDGVESAVNHAAEYNFYTCDGQTLFMRQGDEARCAFGGLNLTAFPGVTARQGEDRLTPVTNWRGYCSKYNFAAAATRGGENACAGFIFEKMNASAKKGVNDKAGLSEKNAVLYGVKAHKSWFVFGDTLLALGAGISNLEPEQEGDIWTTIDQTIWDSPVASKDWKFNHDGKTHQYALASKGSIPWVKQKDGFTYAVLPEHTPGKVSLVAERRASKWDKLAMPNRKRQDKPETTDILQLSINHGRNVQNDTYGYIVYAGEEHPAKVFAKSPVTVLSNTTNLQAAGSLDGKVIQAVFYDPQTTLTAGGHAFSISAPCAFMAEFDDAGRVHLSLTDAEMNPELNEIQVQIDKQMIGVPLPQEPHRGKPATVAVVLD